MSARSLFLTMIIILAAPVAVGCGDDDDNGDGGEAMAPSSTAPQSTTGSPPAARTVTIHMSEFAFDPAEAVAKKGKVTIVAPNDGGDVHELVLLKTDADPADLPKEGNEVDESTSVGEIADVEPSETKEATFTLAPGKYVMVCALPGHYESGMYGTLTVK